MERGGYALVADIGGTNARFAVVQRTSDDHIAIRWQAKHDTQGVTDFAALVNHVLDEARRDGFVPSIASFSVAGPVQGGEAKLSNAAFSVSEGITQYTPLHKALVINDFAAVAESVNVLGPDDVLVLNEGEQRDGTAAVVGAGTGLGKGILYWSGQEYIPIPSEGGHADFPILTAFDERLAEFIKRRTNTIVAEYEEVLSGRGLEAIYAFVQQTRWPRAPPDLNASAISASRETNPAAGETFELFVRYYARCCRNFCLDTFAIGGLYIAGGIAAKNKRAFSTFVAAFTSHERFRGLLKTIPIAIITNEDIGLVGAGAALMRRTR